jgi:hypothetical protein
MSHEDLFDGFDPEEHREEADRRWGQTEAWRESQRRTARYGPEDWKAMKAELDAIHAEYLAAMAEGPPTSDRATDAAEAARRHVDRWFYPCSYEIHGALGELYAADPRFAATYEKLAPGLAAYVRDAIAANAGRRGPAK